MAILGLESSEHVACQVEVQEVENLVVRQADAHVMTEHVGTSGRANLAAKCHVERSEWTGSWCNG